MVTRPHVAPLAARIPDPMAATGGPRCSADALAAAPGETAEEQDARMETALMLRFQASGAEHDFEALYELARGPLLLWIGSLAHSRRTGVEPAELLQDAFVNVYRYASSFRAEGPRSFRVWSRTIAGNLVRRACHLRRRAFQGLPEGLQEPRDRSAGPCAGLQENEERRQLAGAWVLLLARYAAAYEQLPPRAQAALRLVEVEGVSYQESCRRLGVGLSNLKMILFRARRRIRAAIAADLGRAPRAAEGRRSPSLRRAG